MAGKFVCRKDYPVVETKAGKLRGFLLDDTFIFQGIKYADAKRFQMPEPVKPWEGIKDAMSYGFVCPLMEQETPNSEQMVPHRYWPMDENCQYLNIWTPGLDKDAKRPVMVWLHGGGFFAGSSIEQVAYDGENMSKYGNVVVVSLNHRLNILGYLDLSPFGEEYEHSANVGNMDMIAALQWIQDNIAGFGGDPDNVTLFGQSGGGMKVWSLMQMPAADGLFHKGIIESGVIDLLNDNSTEGGERIVKAMLKELNLTEDEVKKLENVPYEQLAAAYKKVSPAIAKEGGYVGTSPHPNADYAGDPRMVGFRNETKHIPLMIGTVLGEFDFRPGMAGRREKTREEAVEFSKAYYGEDGEKMVELFEKAYPGKCLTDVLSVDTLFRKPTIDFIKERVRDEKSRIYSYQFTFEFPLDDGKIAWHCSEIPFVFHNIDKVPVCNAGEASDKLEENVSGAWISFARNGVPSVDGVEWPPCGPDDEATMILDEICEVRHNHDHELIAYCVKNAKPFSLEDADIQH